MSKYSFQDPQEAKSTADLVSTSQVSLAADKQGCLPAITSKIAVTTKRTVGLFGAISLIIGTMIGSGIFASARTVASLSGSVGMLLVVWTCCGLLALFGALVYAELGTTIQESGGEYTYLNKAFGPIPAFMFSWSSILVLRPASLSAICLACGQYIVEPFYPSLEGCFPTLISKEGIAKVIACCVIGIICFINCASVKWATRIQVIFTAAKLAAIALLIITGLVRLGQGYNQNFKNAFEGTTTSISDIGYAFYGGLWAYDGWNNLNYVTEELKNPLRDLPLAIIIGIPLVTGCYVLVNIAYLTVLTQAQISTSGAVAVTLANQLYGVMAWVMPVFVACSTFGAANGSAFTGGRLVYVSAREGHMPKMLALIHRRRHTPLPALVFTCIIAWIMLIPDSSNFDTLINYFSFAAWTFYGATVAALLWLRFSKPDLERPYKVFIGCPVIVLLASVYLVIAPFHDYPLESFYCLLFILMGIPVYFIFVKWKILPKWFLNFIDAVTYKVEALTDSAFTEPDASHDE
ncbi:b(0,+)-type amino acid transporter 1-like isoform X4 [Rhopilema esculentum]|uniref:b(0,+)-type amino acid transporter 1-like isoform X4 n=1 Tax=Rhopilema esculentum TaxID=499914 RepID=UPI0031CFF1D8